MSEHRVTLTVNGRAVTSTVPAQRLLRDFLRDQLGLTGTKGACEDGMCGSCSSRRVREAGAQVPPGPAGRATTGGGDGR
jgi:xanthine dehydrogenase iron-sulfur cluster and FAD-binding subunit A